MSAAARGAVRRINDAYFTPMALAEAIFRSLGAQGIEPRHFLEPSAGDGAFVWASAIVCPSVPLTTTIDIDPERQPKWVGRFQDFAPGQHFDLIGGNPPFNEAESFVRHGLHLCEVGGHVFFLLRAGFLHGAARNPWVQDQLRWYQPLKQRPSFTGDGKTDAADYSLFVWQRGYTGRPEILPALDWRHAR